MHREWGLGAGPIGVHHNIKKEINQSDRRERNVPSIQKAHHCKAMARRRPHKEHQGGRASTMGMEIQNGL